MMKRAPSNELMDQPAADPALIAESLADLAWMNRWLGGSATVLHQLDKVLAGFGRSELTVLDVGAGGGDILATLARWSAGRGLKFQGVALDLAPITAAIALENLRSWGLSNRIHVVRATGARLPFGDRCFDVTLSSTFLHHLDGERAVSVLAEMARVSDWGAVVSDLRRGYAGYLASLALARTVWWRHPYTRHDGPASMKAAFSLAEARHLAERAGLAGVVEAQPAFRWALRWRRDE
jgi:SAM-dependent methyltransferase